MIKIPCIVKEMNDNEAILAMIDCNIDRENQYAERRIRLSDSIPNLDFRTIKRGNKEEIQTKLFERQIKENAKNIKIITVKGERVGFFDGKILEDNIFRMDNIFILKKYQNKGIEKAISSEIL